MRKQVVILISIGLLCCMAMMGQGSSFYSTSAYMTGRQAPVSSYQAPRTIGSLSAISAANYSSLNSEGGACYHAPSGPRRAGRPTDPAIGEGDFRSPIGGVPFGMMVLLVLAYVGYKRKVHKSA